MAVPLIAESFADLLDPIYKEISKGAYDKGKSRIPDVYTVSGSTMESEKYSEVTPLGKVPKFDGVLSYLDIVQGYSVVGTFTEYAAGLQIQRRLYDDDQHDVIPQLFDSFGTAAFKTHEDDAAGVFNNAFTATSDFYTHDEGVALCSSSHTCPDPDVSTASGFSNYGTSSLTKTSLAAARLQMRGVKDNAGDKIDLIMNEMWIPPDLEEKAYEIINTPSGLDSAESNKNFMAEKFQVKVWNRITSTTDWFLCESAERARNLIWFWRVRFETGKMENFDNFTAKARCYMRYGWLWRNFRFIYGSNVS